MINSNELYYLNRALDGEEIYGIDPLENLMTNLGSRKKVKENLINKNLLTKDGKINTASYLLLQGLEKYKNAKEYLWVNSRIVAMDDTNYIIHLERDENRDVILKEVTKSIMLYSIIKENSFLWGNKEVKKEIKFIDPKNFVLDVINKKEEDEILYIKKVSQEGQVFNIYYKENDDLFKYDVTSKLLKKVSPQEVRTELVRLFNMNWGEKIG